MDRTTSDLIALFDVDSAGEKLPEPSWNFAPTQPIPVVIDSAPRSGDDSEPVRRLEAARWGLVPARSEGPSAGAPLFNARSETAAEKAAFSGALEKRRAVVPASGYYEWKTVDGVKAPVFISLPGAELFLFAGLYEWWRNPAVAIDSPDRWLLSATILTRSSTAGLSEIHDRMPVFLDGDLLDEWLDPHSEGTPDLLAAVVAGAAEVAERATSWQVDGAVGSVANNGAALASPLS